MYLNKTRRSPLIIVFLLLLLLSIGVTYLIVSKGILAGPLTLVAAAGIFLLVCVLKDYRVGFYVLFAIGMYMSYLDRLLHIPFPLGIVYDALAAIVFIALFIHNKD